MRYIEIEQTGSPIRRRGDQRQTLVGLKLNKIGRVSWLPDTPATRSMIGKVRHLVKVTHDPAAPRVVAGAPAPDEAADVRLPRDLICDANGIVLEPYDKTALNRGKTPDFKLMKDGELVGYCEVKSLFDPEVLEDPPEGAMTVRKNLPFYGSWANTSGARSNNLMLRIRPTTSRTLWSSSATHRRSSGRI